MAEATTTTFDIDRLPGKSVFNGSFDVANGGRARSHSLHLRVTEDVTVMLRYALQRAC